ncbi:hypothetical protein ACLKA7_001839 [Drosophila subpalustris]
MTFLFLQQKEDETVKILAKAGLQLTKFSSNSKDITPTSENEVFITLDDQDVTKTLGVWLQMHSSKLQCFVANRVSELQENSNVISRHVLSAKNPADIISRGFRASDLLTSMWMKGPGFLKLPSDEWPQLKEPLPPPIEKLHFITTQISLARSYDTWIDGGV